MGMEVNALLPDLSQPGEGKHLKPAGIRQYGLIPRHELMKTAQLFHNLIPGAHMEMIGVRQFNLRLDLFQIRGGNSAFNCSNRPDIHEHRCLYHTVHGRHLRSLCPALLL